jgi:Spy/CpxP family protein refolding chaperone
MKKTSLFFAAAISLASALAQAQTAAPDAASAPADQAVTHREARIEARIKYLHDQLKITSDQEAQWKTVADVMRDNGETLGRLYQERAQAKDLSAVDDLKQYVAISQASADGAKKLADAFEPLYDSFPADQKALADATFRKGPVAEGHARPHKKHAKPAAAANAAAAAPASAASQ